MLKEAPSSVSYKISVIFAVNLKVSSTFQEGTSIPGVPKNGPEIEIIM